MVADAPIDTTGGGGASDMKQCHAALVARDAKPSIPPREGATPCPENTLGWRHNSIDVITQRGRSQWKKRSGYHRRSLVKNLMYRIKTLTGSRSWACRIGSQATEVAIGVGFINRVTTLAPPQSVRIA
jgi:hypothetical protein